MMNGKSPFYDKNRKLMFYRIINTPPTFPPEFSDEACEVIAGLLTANVNDRYGTRIDENGVQHGTRDIKNSKFYAAVNFDKLLSKEIKPPFQPDVVDGTDTTYVPKSYLDATAQDSIVSAKHKGGKLERSNPTFTEFTFAGESVLSAEE